MPASGCNIRNVSSEMKTVRQELIEVTQRNNLLGMPHVVNVGISFVEHNTVLPFTIVQFCLCVPTNHQKVLAVW